MFSLTTFFFLGSSRSLYKDNTVAPSTTSCSSNSPGRKQISLSRSDFLAVRTIHILIGDLKHEEKKTGFHVVREIWVKARGTKLRLPESVRGEKGERGGKSTLTTMITKILQ